MVESSKLTSKLRKTKWNVASDDVFVREYFMAKYRQQFVLLVMEPIRLQHIRETKTSSALDDSRREVVHKAFAEWYLLGVGNELIVNQPHRFGASLLSRSSWFYHFKNEHHTLRNRVVAAGNEFSNADIPVCKRNGFAYEGKLGLIA